MSTLSNPLTQVWELDQFFPGGSESAELRTHLQQLKADIEQFAATLPDVDVPQTGADIEPLVAVVDSYQHISARLVEANSFSTCLVAQNVEDARARIVSAQIRRLGAALEAVLTTLDEKLMAVPEGVWEAFLAHPAVEPVAFGLSERRRRAQDRMSPDKEALAVELGVEGYHGWGQLYTLVSGKIRVPFKENGEQLSLSVGQAANRLSDPDRDIRRRLFDAYEEAWEQQADVLSSTLNNLAGYRLTLYKYRGWESVLKEPLDYNRMSQQTLDAMWSAVERGKRKLLAYFEKKAALLGIEKLSWFDLNAPVGDIGPEKISYDDAAQFIVQQFDRFSPRLRDLAITAFNDRWIEAEDRAGKGAGGFCTSFPLSKQSRIFLTYGGRPTSVDTLAHELGHAYHFEVMKHLPPLARRYPMNLAETASTLAEMVVADGSLRAATDPRQRLSLLDNRLHRAAAFMMDIHARFLFEKGFYDARRRGALRVDELNERMEEAQRRAFLEGLDRFHPLFWASKLHFHITYAPFYNFPYTFGYLFSAGIYSLRKQMGDGFPDMIDNLLMDTGRMTAEEIAAKHLQVDLREEQFWSDAIYHVLRDVDEFVRLTDELMAAGG